MNRFSTFHYYRQLNSACGRRRALEWFIRNSLSHPVDAPLLVLGNQKSGTSAIAALLAKATGETVAIDLKMQVARPVYDLLESGTISFERFVRLNAYSFSRKIVKEPELTFHYHALRKNFPDSKMVFVHREPAENLRSIYERLGIAGDVAKAQRKTLDRLPRAWRMILGAERTAMEDSVPVLENLCERWNRAADAELAAAHSAVSIAYEAFQFDKAAEITDLAAQLGLQVRHSIREDLNTNFQPRSPSGLPGAEFFSASNFQLIRTSCADRAARLGYLNM